jgi:heat shock protein HtpX
LEKLETYSNPKKAVQDGFANEATAGLFIVNPLHKNLKAKNLLSTHPPLEERVRILRKM